MMTRGQCCDHRSEMFRRLHNLLQYVAKEIAKCKVASLHVGLGSRVAIKNRFRKNSEEQTWNGFRFSGEKKCSFHGIPCISEQSILRFGTKVNFAKKAPYQCKGYCKLELRKNYVFQNSSQCFSLSLSGSERVSKSFSLA